MQQAQFIGVGDQEDPTPSTLQIVQFLNKYGYTNTPVLEKEFSRYACQQAVEEGFVEASPSGYRLSYVGALGQPKSVHDLTEEQLDFFVGRAVGKDVYLVPILPGLPEKGLQCVDAEGKPYQPTVDWVEASRIKGERGINLLYPPPTQPWIAETPSIRISDKNPCLAICRCLLALVHGLDESYRCNWRDDNG